jgi:hypothetical protein
LDFSFTAEWGSQEHWVSLALDTYTDLKSDWRLRTDSYATLEFGKALIRDHPQRFYLNTTLELDAHSQLASQGGDITPEINVAKGLTADWWIGGAFAGVLATDPDEGYRRGYASLTLWVTYLSAWLPNESDSIGLSIWAATNEDQEADKALFITLEYEFDIADGWEASAGVGTDPVSPWDHLGIYGQLGIRHRF